MTIGLKLLTAHLLLLAVEPEAASAVLPSPKDANEPMGVGLLQTSPGDTTVDTITTGENPSVSDPPPVPSDAAEEQPVPETPTVNPSAPAEEVAEPDPPILCFRQALLARFQLELKSANEARMLAAIDGIASLLKASDGAPENCQEKEFQTEVVQTVLYRLDMSNPKWVRYAAANFVHQHFNKVVPILWEALDKNPADENEIVVNQGRWQINLPCPSASKKAVEILIYEEVLQIRILQALRDFATSQHSDKDLSNAISSALAAVVIASHSEYREGPIDVAMGAFGPKYLLKGKSHEVQTQLAKIINKSPNSEFAQLAIAWLSSDGEREDEGEDEDDETETPRRGAGTRTAKASEYGVGKVVKNGEFPEDTRPSRFYSGSRQNDRSIYPPRAKRVSNDSKAVSADPTDIKFNDPRNEGGANPAPGA